MVLGSPVGDAEFTAKHVQRVFARADPVLGPTKAGRGLDGSAAVAELCVVLSLCADDADSATSPHHVSCTSL